MLGKQTLVAFVATRDAARARVFYLETLGLALVSDDPFALGLDAHGTTIRVQKVASFQPQPFTALGWTVDDIDAVITAVKQKWAVCEHFPGLEPDAHGIWTSPSGARIEWFEDPDGNVLSLTEF